MSKGVKAPSGDSNDSRPPRSTHSATTGRLRISLVAEADEGAERGGFQLWAINITQPALT